MMRFSFQDAVKISGGRAVVLPIGDAPICGFTWDSRTVTKDCAFIAMPGERVDGNDFAIRAVQAGARLVLGTRQPDAKVRAILAELGAGHIVIQDGPSCLRAFAAVQRMELHDTIVVGITGSCGKTTSKDMVAAVLATQLRTVATQGNRNNELGVPATVLDASEDTQALVVEMGMRGLGQIRDMCSFVKPRIGLITNVGVSHMELLGSRENIARAKGELIEALPLSGSCAILPAQDEYSIFILDCYDPNRERDLLLYGFSDDSDVRGTGLTLDQLGCASFTLELPDGTSAPVHLNIPGQHNASNALGAAAVGYRLGVSIENIVKGLESVQAPSMRMQVQRRSDGLTIINDAYNANPDSMRAALRSLVSMDCSGKRIAILGDMGELGDDALQFHRQVGEYIASLPVDALYCLGELAACIAAGARDAGMDAALIHGCADKPGILEALRESLQPDDIVLVKASRSMGMEEIVKGLMD